MMKKSFFIVFALWVFFLLSIFALGLGFRTLVLVQKTKLFLKNKRAFHLAVSGMKIGRQVLIKDAMDNAVGHLKEDWAALKNEDEKKVEFIRPKASGTISVSIVDEASRINLNTAGREVLTALFEFKGLSNPQEQAGYILDYIDSDSDNRFPESENGVKNAPLSVVQELLLIDAFSEQDYKEIENHLTVFSGGNVNINTVSLELFDVLIDDQGLKDQVLSTRLGGDGLEGTDDDGFYASQNDIPEQLQDTFVIESGVYNIVSQADVGGIKEKITCVYDRKSGKILYWHEE